jgi:hypothetical protein
MLTVGLACQKLLHQPRVFCRGQPAMHSAQSEHACTIVRVWTWATWPLHTYLAPRGHCIRSAVCRGVSACRLNWIMRARAGFLVPDTECGCGTVSTDCGRANVRESMECVSISMHETRNREGCAVGAWRIGCFGWRCSQCRSWSYSRV